MSDDALRQAAKRGVSALVSKARPEQSATVWVDGDEPFELPATLAALLDILARGCAADSESDDVVGWKSRGEVISRLGKARGDCSRRRASSRTSIGSDSYCSSAGASTRA